MDRFKLGEHFEVPLEPGSDLNREEVAVIDTEGNREVARVRVDHGDEDYILSRLNNKGDPNGVGEQQMRLFVLGLLSAGVTIQQIEKAVEATQVDVSGRDVVWSTMNIADVPMGDTSSAINDYARTVTRRAAGREIGE